MHDNNPSLTRVGPGFSATFCKFHCVVEDNRHSQTSSVFSALPLCTYGSHRLAHSLFPVNKVKMLQQNTAVNYLLNEGNLMVIINMKTQHILIFFMTSVETYFLQA